MRLFAATFATETNHFSPLPTGLSSYKACLYLGPGEHPEDAPLFCTEPLWVARRRAAEDGFTLIQGSCFAAYPAGVTVREDYEKMRDVILGELEAALPVDGVLLGLHGAMVADGYEDVEGDILERVRRLVGPDCVIGVELDPHCHLTVKRVRLADIIVMYKEYPHTDMVECAEKMLNLVLRTLRGEIRPIMSVFDCRQIQNSLTTTAPMRDFVDRVNTLEGEEGVLSISICHCFPWADVPELSARILVMTDGDKGKGDSLATLLGNELIALRGKLDPEYFSVDAGIDAALQSPEAPIMITDRSDAAGAGAASDNTTILRRLVERQVENVTIGPIWDPVAASICFDAGIGSRFALRFGGKAGPSSGLPIDAEVVVIGLKRDVWLDFGPRRTSIGDCAAVRMDGIEVVLVSKRSISTSEKLFSDLGIDPFEKKIVVLKAGRPLMTETGPATIKMISVESDGIQRLDYRQIPYQRIARPIWPLDEVTFPKLVF